MELNELGQICITGLPGWVITIVAGATSVFVSSVFANFVKPDSKIGKVTNWLALNIKTTKPKA